MITVQSLHSRLPYAELLLALSSNSFVCFKVYAISHPVSRVLVHFLTSPPFYLAFKQTLDASKPRLLTPFNGPDPPSDIVDKIAQSRRARGPR